MFSYCSSSYNLVSVLFPSLTDALTTDINRVEDTVHVKRDIISASEAGIRNRYQKQVSERGITNIIIIS